MPKKEEKTRAQAEMKVEMRPIEEITPYDHNPRINELAVRACATSIQEFGFRQPIVVDEDGVIIVGHTRFKAAVELGLKEVPVHVAEGLTPAQAKAYRIADNKIGEIAKWDWMALGEEIADLVGLGVEDLSVLGFSEEQLQSIMSGVPAGFIDDLVQVPMIEKGTSADAFSMTFVFENRYREAFDEWMEKNGGKTGLTARIIEVVTGHLDDLLNPEKEPEEAFISDEEEEGDY